MIDGLVNAGSLPALEAMMRFSGARQRVLAHNIANADTPNFRPVDVDPTHFQNLLSDAVDKRRTRTGGTHGELDLGESRQIATGPDGRLVLTPRTPSGNVLFHDRNNRDLERMMQDLVENAGAYQVATNLMRSRMGMLRTAISQRV